MTTKRKFRCNVISGLRPTPESALKSYWVGTAHPTKNLTHLRYKPLYPRPCLWREVLELHAQADILGVAADVADAPGNPQSLLCLREVHHEVDYRVHVHDLLEHFPGVPDIFITHWQPSLLISAM